MAYNETEFEKIIYVIYIYIIESICSTLETSYCSFTTQYYKSIILQNIIIVFIIHSCMLGQFRHVQLFAALWTRESEFSWEEFYM